MRTSSSSLACSFLPREDLFCWYFAAAFSMAACSPGLVLLLLRIQIMHALSQLDSCTRRWMGGRVAAHAMVWSRLPGRRGLLIRFEKSAAHKLKCTRNLRSLASGCT